jgi:biopolymer transport protein ExbB/TolQ
MASRLFATVKGLLTTNVLLFLIAAIVLLASLTVFLFGRRIWQFIQRRGSGRSLEESRTYSDVEFYKKLLHVMEQRGVSRDKHQTPLEFADKLRSHDVMIITRAYNRVRFGGERLSAREKREVERALVVVEADFQG